MKSKVLKSGIFFAVISFFSVACNKDISVGSGDDTDNRNVFIAPYFTYNGNPFSSDSIYLDSFGNRFVIDNIQIIISNFFIAGQGDTVKDPNSFNVLNFRDQQFKVLKLPKGTYSGSYGFTIGMDSLTNSKLPGTFPSTSGLRDPALYRGRKPFYFGYKFLLIEGRVFNPLGIDTLGPKRFFTYELGDSLTLTRTRQKSFTASNDKPIVFEVRFDIADMLEPFDLFVGDTILTDRRYLDDFADALLLRDYLDSAITPF
jgi:hypothetical protein